MKLARKKHRRTTYAGRIVYDRPKHLFNVKDIARIASKLPDVASSGEAAKYLSMSASIIINILRPLAKKLHVFDFVGGVIDMFYDVTEYFLDSFQKIDMGEQFLISMHITTGEQLPPSIPVIAETMPTQALKTLGELYSWRDPLTGYLWVNVTKKPSSFVNGYQPPISV